MPVVKTRGLFRKSFENITELLSCRGCREHGADVANQAVRFRCRERQCECSSGRTRMEFPKEVYEEEKAVETKVAGSSERKKKQGSGRWEKGTASEGEFELARRMKELDMMDSDGDLEQVLDVEEALHYYSRLKSPVYMEIVDRFFMDMYNDFSTPPRLSPQLQQQHPSALTKHGTSSRRRLGSF
ncbi:hypothetical protein MLD38_030200 [Melastoma candidum]|uniref:Uncharacterized protein n=1 Tax=Melastoma candidum TaxID=119954 RepID=A0ACB9ML20_9MYRT|nr:hypothetical protein MLD38_030200 [Melastoma candidum]